MAPIAVELSPASPVGALVTGSLVSGAARLRRSVAMVEASEYDGVHQVRVSCRRLRSDLRLYRRLLTGDQALQLRQELSQLAMSCSQARDLEVVSALIRDHATSEDDADYVATILHLLATSLERAAATAEAAVASQRTAMLLDLLDAVAAAPELRARADRPCAKVLPRLLDATRIKFTEAADQLTQWSPDEQWHDVRLDAKRLRYAAESVSVVLGEEAKELAGRAAKFQDLLGQHQDHCAAADTLWLFLDEADKAGDVEMAFALGRLMERHRAARRPLREEFLAHYHRP
ncbi:CHAD domain-containing protein [Kribbella sp. NBC_01245]|uniref:CHAD domain-containing protein n=1 Tax=Kribbella sp. NBC_01245 TaxID=2903578 RepID=UPI002E2BA61D|nr:CHAD domain-containing protein [Kribbella sp. NBC_01245]